MDKDEARQYLTSLLNKNLRILASDGRVFLGQFKCTDADENVVLANTYEYRQPSQNKVKAAQDSATAAAAAAAAAAGAGENQNQESSTSRGTVKLDMTSRYLGLVVVPGEHIRKIEVEQFASQMKGRSVLSKRSGGMSAA